MGNALLGLRLRSVDFRVIWAVDGVLKISTGPAMAWVSFADAG
jgi:hypothetical protein